MPPVIVHRRSDNPQSHIAIVGAGIAGLATALALRRSGFEGRLSIFDKGHGPGGRLWSGRLEGDPLVMEYGAGRFHAGRHRRLVALCEQLGLPVMRFDYRARCTGDRSDSNGRTARLRWQGMLARLRQAVPLHAAEHPSFASFCSHILGAALAHELQSRCGYDSLLNAAMPVEGGMSILAHHPETQSLFEGHTDHWYTLRDGFQGLGRALKQQLQDEVDFAFGASLEAIRQMQDGSFRLQFVALGSGECVDVGADRVVLATPLQELKGVHGLQALAAADPWRRLEAIPLLKGCIRFERPWWREPGTAQALIADTPLRKVYVTPGSNALWFYCDGASARKLHSVLDAAEAFPIELLEEHLGQRRPAGGPAPTLRWKYWEHGISFFRRSAETAAAAEFAQLAPGLSICSDIYTEHLGWVEGALASADAIAAHWLDAESEQRDFRHGCRPAPIALRR